MQTLEAFQPLLERGADQDAAGRLRLCHDLLDAIATHRVADRPDRFEPRVKKRRRNHYGWLTKPRAELKRQMAKCVRDGFKTRFGMVSAGVVGERSQPCGGPSGC